MDDSKLDSILKIFNDYNVLNYGDAIQLPTLWWDHAAVIVPHPAKLDRGGEDAASSSLDLMVVSDGVGGWSTEGVDPGLYSRELVSRVVDEHAGGDWDNLVGNDRLVAIVEAAANNVGAIGSATLNVCYLDPVRRKLYGLNLGDSGYLVYRPSLKKVVGRSEFQTHGWNTPLQLGTCSTDTPKDSNLTEVAVRPGDIMLLASDGVWDNLEDKQYIPILKKNLTPSRLAKEIATLAFKMSQDRSYLSPFFRRQKKDIKSPDEEDTGGKPDDITVVVGIVRQSNLRAKL